MKYLSSALLTSLEELGTEVEASEHTPELVAESNAQIDALIDAHEDLINTHNELVEVDELSENLGEAIDGIENHVIPENPTEAQLAVSQEQLRFAYRDLNKVYASIGIPTVSTESVGGVLSGAKDKAAAVSKLALEKIKALIERFKAFLVRLFSATESLKKRASALKSKAAATKGELSKDAKNTVHGDRVGFKGEAAAVDIIAGLKETGAVLRRLEAHLERGAGSNAFDAIAGGDIIGNLAVKIGIDGQVHLLRLTAKTSVADPLKKAQVEEIAELVLGVLKRIESVKSAADNLETTHDGNADKQKALTTKIHGFTAVTISVVRSLKSVLALSEQSLNQHTES